MITLDVSHLTLVFLIAIRIGMILLVTPIEAFRLLPIHVRIILILAISMLMEQTMTVSSIPIENSALVLSGVMECLNGLLLSISIAMTFSVFQMAGQLIDTQMGLNGSAIFNPSDHTHEPLSSRLLMMFGVLYFLALHGHHHLLQAISHSFKIIPPGQLSLFHGVTPIFRQCTLMFSFALWIASPIMMSLMIIDLAGGILTRTMPGISPYFLTLPFKMIVGLLIFRLLIQGIAPLIEKNMNACFQSMVEMLS